MTKLAAKLNKLLTFVAIGTIADAQSVLEPTNRLLIKSGIKVFNSTNLYSGLESIVQELGLREKMKTGYQIDSQDIAFLFSPILNASGRITHANLSIQALVQTGSKLENTLASQLIQINQDRKQIVKEYTQDLDSQVKQQVQNGNKLIWLVGKWNKGVVGLIASRIQNQVNLPVAVISMGDEENTGSFRAPNGYNLPNALNNSSDLLEKFGGHPQAAGFTFKQENITILESKLNQFFNENQIDTSLPDPDQLRRVHLISTEINQDVLQEFSNLDPFGIDFPTPLISLSSDSFRTFMKSEMGLGKHHKYSNNGIDFVFFNIEPELRNYLENPTSRQVNLDFSISRNYWKGRMSYQLIFQKISKT